MTNDPIIEEIRRVRHAHAVRFNYDLNAIARDLQKGEKRFRHKLVSFKPRKVSKA
jgi:hypothetical protein